MSSGLSLSFGFAEHVVVFVGRLEFVDGGFVEIEVVVEVVEFA